MNAFNGTQNFTNNNNQNTANSVNKLTVQDLQNYIKEKLVTNSTLNTSSKRKQTTSPIPSTSISSPNTRNKRNVPPSIPSLSYGFSSQPINQIVPQPRFINTNRHNIMLLVIITIIKIEMIIDLIGNVKVVIYISVIFRLWNGGKGIKKDVNRKEIEMVS